MKFILYKIVNIQNGKFYIGVHRTNDVNDDYMGSGTLIKRAIKKHGVENFKKEILEFFETEDEMLKREEEIVTYEFIKENNVYNIMPGGNYGSEKRNGLTFKNKHHTQKSKDKIRKKSIGRHHTIETKEKISQNNFSKNDPVRHLAIVKKAGSMIKTETHRKNISEALKRRYEKDKPNVGLIREKLKCPKCGKLGAKNVMVRWHFEKCRK